MLGISSFTALPVKSRAPALRLFLYFEGEGVGGVVGSLARAWQLSVVVSRVESVFFFVF